jgi:hypothetical protein
MIQGARLAKSRINDTGEPMAVLNFRYRRWSRFIEDGAAQMALRVGLRSCFLFD